MKFYDREEEQELLRLFPSPSNRVIRNNLVANKADWQYSVKLPCKSRK